jgi:ubiquinone/menaquinone biosynthesis C-methylase UbiE
MVIRNNVNTIGVNLSNVALRILLNNGFQRHVVQADCQYLPFKDGSFDCLISNQVIEHMPSLTL